MTTATEQIRKPGELPSFIKGLGGLLCLCALLFGAVLLSARLGFVEFSFGEVLTALWHGITGAEGQSTAAETARVMVWEVRLPRILTAAAAGAGLAVAGAVYQNILLNPLADPYTLGVSSGAAFGAAVALLFGMGKAVVSVPLFAFSGAILTLFIVIAMASPSGRLLRCGIDSSNLILSGIMVSAILSAGLSFMKYLADEQVSVIIFWLMGSFAAATWQDAAILTGVTAAGFLLFLFYARDLNLLALGEKSARSLGVDTSKTVLILLVAASLVAAICVAVSGIIGFVGLLVPHMVRFVTGPDSRKLLPATLITGAILLLFADTVTRAVLPYEVPIGVLTALIGGPVFCVIFRKSRMGGGA
ncbi:corrinoid ABC transporter permease [Desulfoluna limicola]|uniref:Corrinoid ABC transporter permease n=1 Tax=Desulfoluna limicola TaxID=2810562 RepID=A0ABM7PBV5_9BACT|nr:iron ABC transporter permease [Desulfoluna limicola]BCS94561.1 corrinoid ABC transporter permease [Desulfoluna limicola]